jgi:hypothetical protein
MKRYRIIETDREPISDASLGSLKPPFQTLLENYSSRKHPHRRPLLQRYALIALATAAAIGLMLVSWFFFAGQHNDGRLVPGEPLQLAEPMIRREVQPPAPEMIHYERFVVKPGQKGTFKTSKGSTITVPANAFAYRDGTPCNQEVEVRFAEFQTVVEIFLSGIPMQYDSAGISYTFESAGMFDVRASSQGEDLILASHKGIEVNLASNAPEPYNFYYFDTTAGRWDYAYTETAGSLQRGPSAPPAPMPRAAEITPQPSETARKLQTDPQSDVQTTLPIIRKRDPRKQAFKIDYDEAAFPELAGTKDLIFEVDDTEENRKYLRGTWDSISLQRMPDLLYHITLYRLKRSIHIKAQPVLNTDQYEAALETRLAQEAKIAAMRQQQQATVVAARSAGPAIDTEISVFAFLRGATVYNLGIYNWDVPVPMPMAAVNGTGRFLDARGEFFNPKQIYLAQKGRTILWSYTTAQAWKYSASQENVLWYILPDGRYALVDDETLKARRRDLVPRIVSKAEALEEIGKFI